MSAIPADVRARILGHLRVAESATSAASPARAQSIHEPGATTAGLVALIRSRDPALGDVADRIMAAPVIMPTGHDAIAREMRTTAVALRIASYRREIGVLGARLIDTPDDAASGARVRDLAQAVHALETRFPEAVGRARAGGGA